MIDAGAALVVIGTVFVVISTVGMTWRFVYLERHGAALRRELEQRYR